MKAGIQLIDITRSLRCAGLDWRCTRCHPEEAESFAARRAPDEGPMHFLDVSGGKTLPDLVTRFHAGFEPILRVRAARNAWVLRLLSSRFAGRKTALRMTPSDIGSFEENRASGSAGLSRDLGF